MQNVFVTVSIDKTLSRLRNTRDLRAEVVSLAAELVANNAPGHLTVADPAISPSTVQGEWDRLLRALDPGIRIRMRLDIEQSSKHDDARDLIPVDRPNYRYEVLRLLLGATLSASAADSLKGLMERIGASQTPIREAIVELKRAGVVHVSGRRLRVVPEELSQELLARVGALPRTLRFSHERGAMIKPPAVLAERVLPLLQNASDGGWGQIALSGVAAAHVDVPHLDLMGIPRLDLVARVPRDAKDFDGSLLRQLDDGLELEPSVLAPAPVVVTMVRADTPFFRVAALGHVRCSFPTDIFLAMLDMGLRDQALQYAKAVRDAAGESGP
jgi:Bacterial regulatory proteins, gntR family